MKVFLIILIILLILRWLLKPLIRFTVHTTVNKMADELQKHQNQQHKQKPEGTLSVDYVPPKDKKKPKGSGSSDNGDYVDFEEIK